MEDLPKNWENWPLADVGEWLGGGTPASSNAKYWNGDIPWVSPKDMKVAVITSTQDKITNTAIENSATKLIPAGAVLFVTRSGILAHSFPVATTRDAVTVNQDLKAIVPVPAIDYEYLAWTLRFLERKVLGSCSKHGTTVHSIEVPSLKSLNVPIPPLPEQRRIVAKIEELFSELDKGIESLTTAREQLKAYRQSVLKYAFDKATESRLLPTVLAEPFSNGYSGKPVQKVTPWRVLSLSATTSGVFNGEHYKYLDEPGLESRDIWCEPGDVLVQRGNTIGYVGIPALYTGESKEFIFPDLMIRLRANPYIISPAYLCYAMSTPAMRDEMRSRAKGSAGTMPKISQKILAELKIPYCKPDVQRRITEQIDTLNSHANAFEADIDIQLAKSNALRQSILKQAFSGQLVAQNPTDEPATVLLERIRAERERAPAKNGRTVRNTDAKNGSKNGQKDRKKQLA